MTGITPAVATPIELPLPCALPAPMGDQNELLAYTCQFALYYPNALVENASASGPPPAFPLAQFPGAAARFVVDVASNGTCAPARVFFNVGCAELAAAVAGYPFRAAAETEVLVADKIREYHDDALYTILTGEPNTDVGAAGEVGDAFLGTACQRPVREAVVGTAMDPTAGTIRALIGVRIGDPGLREIIDGLCGASSALVNS